MNPREEWGIFPRAIPGFTSAWVSERSLTPWRLPGRWTRRSLGQCADPSDHRRQRGGRDRAANFSRDCKHEVRRDSCFEMPGCSQFLASIPGEQMSNKVSRRSFLATSCLTATAIARSASTTQLSTNRAGETGAKLGRFNGTVAIFYIAHFQAVSRDWDSIEEYKGPYHPLLGYYRYKTKDDRLKHLKWLRRAGVDAIVYDVLWICRVDAHGY